MPKTVEGYGQNPRIDFWSHKDITPTDCWVWRGGKNKSGQGCVSFCGKVEIASRVAWKLFYGSIPAELCVLHKCDNPSCINPLNLFLGTYRDNSLDMWEKGRHSKKPRRSAPCHPNRPHLARNMCRACYLRWYKTRA